MQKSAVDIDIALSHLNKGHHPKTSDVAHWIKVATKRIVENFQPEQVILFGSQARGDAHEDSDVDFLVVFQHVDSKKETTIAIRRTLARLPIAKDIVVTTKQEIDDYGHIVGRVLLPALQEGKILYERR
ncbi:MAG: nucleotidyltransferase domain-containing protein [Cyanobacteria bacterium J06598_3]